MGWREGWDGVETLFSSPNHRTEIWRYIPRTEKKKKERIEHPTPLLHPTSVKSVTTESLVSKGSSMTKQSLSGVT